MTSKHSTSWLKNPQTIISTLNDGSPNRRRVCSQHPGLHRAEKNGASSQTEVTDQREENHQTLCADCHIYKTFVAGDNLTPGRKTLGKYD